MSEVSNFEKPTPLTPANLSIIEYNPPCLGLCKSD